MAKTQPKKLVKTSIVSATYLPSKTKGQISFDDYGVIFTPATETAEVKSFIIRFDQIVDAVQIAKLFKPLIVTITDKQGKQFSFQSKSAAGVIAYIFTKF